MVLRTLFILLMFSAKLDTVFIPLFERVNITGLNLKDFQHFYVKLVAISNFVRAFVYVYCDAGHIRKISFIAGICNHLHLVIKI